MTDVVAEFSIADRSSREASKKLTAQRRKSLSSATTTSNLFFDHQRRSRITQGSTPLPIISLPSFDDFKEKLKSVSSNSISNNKHRPTTPVIADFRLKMPRAENSTNKTRLAGRVAVTNMPKSSLSYPTTIFPSNNNSNRASLFNGYQKPLVQNSKYLYIVNTPISTRRTASARVSSQPTSTPTTATMTTAAAGATMSPSSLLPRSNSQYSHFLAYLRRQSLARLRRRQESEEGQHENLETTVVISPAKAPSVTFQSASNLSISMTSSTDSAPNSSRKHFRPNSSTFRLANRSNSMNNSRTQTNSNFAPLTTSLNKISTKKSHHEHVEPSTSSKVVLTPNNSIVEEIISSNIRKAPYELQLSGDVLNYCYVSDTGVKYQGQLLSSVV